MERLGIALRGIFYILLFMALWTLAALMLRPLDAFIPAQIPSAFRGLGLALMVVGVALCLATAGCFIFKGRGTPAIFDPPKKFVPLGPYRFVRNPMYMGYVSGLLGLGGYLRSISIVAFASIAFTLIHTFVVLAEEPGLRRRFGQQYLDYSRAVGRWIPRFTRRRRSAT